MGIENDLKLGKTMGIDGLQKMVRMRQSEEKDIRKTVLERQKDAKLQNPKANIATLAKGIRMIQTKYPVEARLLSSILLLTHRFTRTHDQAIEIVAKEVKKPIGFIESMEKVAIRRVMDAIASSKIIQFA